VTQGVWSVKNSAAYPRLSSRTSRGGTGFG